MEHRRMFVGMDVHEEWIDISLAEEGRDGEVRHGEVRHDGGIAPPTAPTVQMSRAPR